MRQSPVRYLVPLLVSGLCLILFMACVPEQVPREGTMEELPGHPDALLIETVPAEVAEFITVTESRLGASCPGIWRSYLISDTVTGVSWWYRSAMGAQGWLDAAQEVSVRRIPLPEQEGEAPTRIVWYQDNRETKARGIVTLFLNPVGLIVAPAEAAPEVDAETTPEGEVEATPEGEAEATPTSEAEPSAPITYTYALVFYCPIHE